MEKNVKLTVSYDVSGYKTENAYDLMGFALNKIHKCKNNLGVIGNTNLNENVINSKYIKHYTFGTSNHEISALELNFNTDNIPIYCKEIPLYLYNNNKNDKATSFVDLEFLKIKLNDEVIFFKEVSGDSLPDKHTFHIGNFVRRNDTDFDFVPATEFINSKITEIATVFDIELKYDN